MPILALIFMLSLVGVVSLVILLAVLPAAPLTGAVVRLRANYNPRGLQLDLEGGEQPRTGPTVTSFFAMLARVYKIEGWSGLYKGLMPTLLLIPITATLFLFRLMSTGNLRFDKYDTLSTSVTGALAYTLLTIIFLPLTIIVYRAITTPHRLPFFNPNHSLRILLTPVERQRPWILYLTPGLLAAQFSQIVCIILGLGTVRRLLLPELNQPDLPPTEDFSEVRLAIFFALALAGAAVLTPLEVISTRLAIQQNHGSNPISQENNGAQEVRAYAATGEDVISLRTEQEPYAGLFDCAKKIVEEEGWGALYRAWWWTMLGLAFI